jgi:hypothetical protein
MVNANLKDLPGFSPSYIGFVEGATIHGQVLPDRPEKGALLSRCRSTLNWMQRSAATSEMLVKAAPIVTGSRLWSESIGKLKNCSAVVVGGSADAAEFSSSLAPLLRCLTVIKLAHEISREDVPAVPLVWVGASAQVQEYGGGISDSVEPRPAGKRNAGSLGPDLINYSNNRSEPTSGKDINSDSSRDVLMQLARDFGLILVDSASVRVALSGGVESEDLWRRVASISVGETDDSSNHNRSGRDPATPGRPRDALLFRLSVPAGAQVVGPEDYDTALLVRSLVGSAGRPEPFLWPRVSATFVDRRSVRAMERYKLGLPDLLQGNVAQSKRLGFDRTASDISSRLEGLAGTIRRRIDEIGVRAARDPRAVRRIRTSGSKMLYQLSKLAMRSRRFADAHQDTAARQLERVCGLVAPGGGLQERGLGTLQFLSQYPESVLEVLYRKINVWDLKHQIIVGLD